MTEILQTKNLSKHFDGIRAVDRLSISIEKGMVTSIIGPNGSGKTTLINLISGVIPSDSGVVIVNGFTLEKIETHNLPTYGITRTFQDIRLFEQMTVQDNILVVLTERGVLSTLFGSGIHKKYYLKEVEDVLKRVNLFEKRDELAINLSYGQRKLLEIARAISMKVDVFLFDEPFAGLFPEMMKIIISIIRELKKQKKTVVLIEHDMNMIRELSDHVIVMDEGRLLTEGKSEKVLSQKNVIDAYLGE